MTTYSAVALSGIKALGAPHTWSREATVAEKVSESFLEEGDLEAGGTQQLQGQDLYIL